MKVSEFSLMLKPSTIPGAGVGLFALEDIANGTEIGRSEDIPKSFRTKDQIPSEFLGYCIAQDDGTWLCPKDFNKMERSWFINHHADRKNVGLFEGHILKVVKDIKKGEEILMDYNDLGEPEDLKEDYYK